MCTVFSPASVHAQERDSGKEVVKGLLKALVESQLEREQGRGNLRPGRGPGQGPAPGQGTAPGQITAELVQLRPVVSGYAQELATLTALLNTDARRSFEVRRWLADALRLQATAASVRQRADIERDHRGLTPAFLSLNAEWKSLSYNLRSANGISPQSLECINRIDGLDAQYCRILGIQERFDGRELVRAADALTSEFRVLADEVSYSQPSGPSGAGRSRTTSSLRRLQDRAQLLANMASEQVPFRTMVSEYQSLFQSWQQVRPELAAYSARGVVRATGRIQEIHATIHQLLRLEFGVDPALVQQLVQAVQRDLGDLFRTITLEQLILLRDHRSIAISADELAGSAENLADIVARQEGTMAINEAWFYLDESWRLFSYYIEPLKAPESRRRADVAAQSLESLRSILGVSVAFDQRVVSQQAASLVGLAESMQSAVRRWQARPGNQDRSIQRDTDNLLTRCQELESLGNSARKQAMLQARCDEVLVLWQALRPRLLECATEEREALLSHADSFTPELVRMRMMVGE